MNNLSERNFRGREAFVDCDGVNVGAADLLAYQPVGISGHFFSGDAAQKRRAFEVATATADDERRFGICLEPIRQDYVGRVVMAGVCLARLKNPGNLDFADVADGQNYLEGVDEGGAQILWEDSFVGDAIHLGLIRFPHGGAGGGTKTAVVATTANDTLSGLAARDGVTPTDGALVLAWKQTTASQNGLYTAAAGAWTKTGQPEIVHILGGTYARTFFTLTAANTYKPNLGVFK